VRTEEQRLHREEQEQHEEDVADREPLLFGFHTCAAFFCRRRPADGYANNGLEDEWFAALNRN
jgi:hypothetical protein